MTNAQSTARHNALQRAYCEGFVSTTILPRESPHLRKQLDEILRAARIAPGERALEVGCGLGRFTLPLAASGVPIEGMDLSPMLLERFRAFDAGRFNVPVTVGDILAPPAEFAGRFDVVLGLFVLHHLADLDDALAGMGRLLKPGGRLVLLDANGINPLFYVQLLLTPGMTWAGDKGIASMRRGRVSRALIGAGFSAPAVRAFGCLPAALADRPWGARIDRVLDRLPLPRVCRAFQIFTAERA